MSDSTQPLDEKRTARLAASHWRISVREGPDAGQERRLESGVLTAGKDADCELPLSDTAVSRRHASFTVEGDRLVLRDLGSRNGTFLDGHRVKEVELRPGCQIRVGRTMLQVDSGTHALRLPPAAETSFRGLYGKSLAMRQVFALLARVAASDTSVVLHGETGTGKEEAARALHEASPRAKGPFVVLDCSGVDRELISAQLFGHEVGAFTGAVGARAGSFERAHRGTIFLDEIGELPLDLQPKLLRALESREVTRLGSDKPFRFDVRLVSATHRKLDAMVAAGTFRQDLVFRLRQIEVALPPLRTRPEDVAGLVEQLVERSPQRGTAAATRFSAEALAVLERLAWPGNVRELRNAVERALTLSPGPEVTPGDLMLDGAEAERPDTLAGRSLDEIEKEAIAQTLARFAGNKTRAAKALGIAVNTLREKLRRHALDDGE